MDIRNINPVELKLKPEEYIGKMYELGIEQLNGYLNIEGLPGYPIDINTKSSQVILKDFIGRVIEELCEGHESLIEIDKILDPIGYNLEIIEEDKVKELVNHIQNANEEQADAVGFFITLLLYSNILSEDIEEYFKSKMDWESHNLDSLMSYGIKLVLESNDTIQEDIHMICYNIVPSYIVEGTLDEYAPGFHKFSPVKLELSSKIIFQIVYQLNIARNLLKNRSWKQTSVMTKELDYQEAVVKAFYLFLGYLGINGFTGSTLFNLFYRKQQLNLWRQKTGY